jgi:hypothetical protein
MKGFLASSPHFPIYKQQKLLFVFVFILAHSDTPYLWADNITNEDWEWYIDRRSHEQHINGTGSFQAEERPCQTQFL